MQLETSTSVDRLGDTTNNINYIIKNIMEIF